MSRADAEIAIMGSPFGFPGEDWDMEEGRLLANKLLDEMGLNALTDEAVVRLAELHKARDRQRRGLAAAAPAHQQERAALEPTMQLTGG